MLLKLKVYGRTENSLQRKYKQIKEHQIELQEGPTKEMLILTVSDIDDNLLFSAVYFDEFAARQAYHLAYDCINSGLPLERIYGT